MEITKKAKAKLQDMINAPDKYYMKVFLIATPVAIICTVANAVMLYILLNI